MQHSILQTTLYLFRLLRGHRLQAALNTLLGVSLIALDLAFVWATKLTVDVATGQNQVVSLSESLGIIAGVMVARIVLSLSSRWIRAILGVKAQNTMQRRLFERLLGCQWMAMRKYHTGNLTNRLERDVTDVVNFTAETIPSFVTTLFQFTGAFVFLYIMDSSLALVVACVAPVFLLISKLYVKKMRELTRQSREEEAAIQSTIQETLQHDLVVKTLRLAGEFARIVANQQRVLHGLVLRRTRCSTVSSALMSIGFGAGYFVAFAWGVISLSKGAITYGAMLAFIQLVGQIQSPVRSLSKFIPVFISSFTAAERLMEMEELPLETVGDETVSKLDTPIGLRLQEVSFQYTENQRKVFDHYSCSFPAGSVTAIVGETGAGKTTLIRLLLSLVNPSDGTVEVTGKDGKWQRMEASMRGNFAYVPQGNTLFSGTIRSNLLLGNPSANEEELKRALHLAGADFVLKKPLGLDTPCSEIGGGLSEGQAQRVAIARAMLADGGVFIFDEATSSLDPQTEATVLQRIIESSKGRTLIFITHREQVLKYADQVIRI